MKKYPLLLIILAIISCQPDLRFNHPPLAEIRMVSDNYYGFEIQDPYRYMENLEDTSVQAWLKRQADHTRKILDNMFKENLSLYFDFK